MGYLPRKF